MVTDLINEQVELKPLTYSIGDIIELTDESGGYAKVKVHALTDKRLYLDILPSDTKPQ